jgi:uridylate kinase
VVGAGNIYRGMAAAAEGMDRATGDYAGMLATVLNSLALQDALEDRGAYTRILSALELKEVAEPYIRRRANPPPREGADRHLRRRYRATRSSRRTRRRAACARDQRGHDPDGQARHRRASTPVTRGSIRMRQFLPEVTHLQAIERGLKVMDTTALSLCMDNNLPIHVFALADGNIRRVVAGERVGTIISTPAKEES